MNNSQKGGKILQPVSLLRDVEFDQEVLGQSCVKLEGGGALGDSVRRWVPGTRRGALSPPRQPCSVRGFGGNEWLDCLKLELATWRVSTRPTGMGRDVTPAPMSGTYAYGGPETLYTQHNRSTAIFTASFAETLGGGRRAGPHTALLCTARPDGSGQAVQTLEGLMEPCSHDFKMP
eukprot:m.66818 g.66818  ORF g.66818 m.66818 type:complete len:176 (-) comp9833_c1_seq1:73-600(-)